MAYCTLADIQKQIDSTRILELTDDEHTGVISSDRVSDAITKAAAEIDAYASTRYQVPFADPAPAVIRKLAIDMAIYHLHFRRPEICPQWVKDVYEAAIKTCEGISKGLLNLGLPAASEIALADSGGDFTASDRVFTREKLRGY